jgi:hypothetical protein
MQGDGGWGEAAGEGGAEGSGGGRRRRRKAPGGGEGGGASGGRGRRTRGGELGGGRGGGRDGGGERDAEGEGAGEGGAEPSESTTRKLVVRYGRERAGSRLAEAAMAARKVETISGSHWVPVPSLSIVSASLSSSALR